MSSYSFYPIENHNLLRLYKLHLSTFWVADEIDFANDRNDWDKLPKSVQKFVTFILAFFSQADGIICENLMTNFQRETSFIKEAGYFYSIQNLMENVHNESYSIMIDTCIRDVDEKNKALNAIHTIPEIAAIKKWIDHWMNADIPLLERIVAFACIEGILFTGAFAGIYWIKQKNTLEGVTSSNELIARDERLHTEFGAALYATLVNDHNYPRLPQVRIHEIIRSATCDIAEPWIRESLKVDLVGLSPDDMVKYIKCAADNICSLFSCEPLFHETNPFDWMLLIALQIKTNFFEKRVNAYKRNNNGDLNFNLECDF